MRLSFPRLRPTIRLRISAAFAVLIVLGMLVSGLSVLRSWQLDGQIGALADLNAQKDRMDQQTLELKHLRLLETQYRLNPDRATQDGMTAAREALARMIGAAADHAGTDDERARLADLIAMLDRHKAATDRLVRMSRTAAGTLGRLNAVGEEVNSRITELVSAVDDDAEALRAADQLDRSILQMRVAGLRFLSAPDAGVRPLFEKRLATLRTQLSLTAPLLGDAARLLPPIGDNIREYGSVFQVLAQNRLDIASLFDGDVTSGITALDQALAEITARLDERFEQTQTATIAGSQNSAKVSMILAASALLIGTLLAWLIGRALTRPLAAITKAMERLAQGEMSDDNAQAARRDEIGAMARTLDVFRANARAAAELAASQQEAQTARIRRGTRLEELIASFEQRMAALMTSLGDASRTMTHTAEGLSADATQTDSQSMSVAGAATQTMASVEAVAAAAEELAVSIQEISRQVAKSSEIATRSVHGAHEADAKVRRLAAAAHQIGDVVALISSIAGQTNLLALNATIEAARAGDAGKGFAVVAGEVKALAGQTSRATQDISAQIAAIQTATREAMEAIGAIGETIQEISEIGGSIANAIEQQGLATSAIARNVAHAAAGSRGVAGQIDDVRNAARRTGEVASGLLGVAAQVADNAEQVRGEMGQFVAGVQAA